MVNVDPQSNSSVFVAPAKPTRARPHEDEDARAVRRLRALVSSTFQVMWTMDANGAVVEDSPSWRAFTGESASAWLDADARREVLHPDERDRLRASWAELLLAKRRVETEARIRRPGGGYTWVIIRVAPVLDDDGEVLEWIGTYTDIDAQKRAEQSLRILARVSEVLEAPAEGREALSRLPDALVPALADHCALFLVEGPAPLSPVAAVHRSLERRPLYHDLYLRAGVAEVMRNGVPAVLLGDEVQRWLPEVTEAAPRTIAMVPLRDQGRVHGALCFAVDSLYPQRSFDADALALAEEVAARAAVAYVSSQRSTERRRTIEMLWSTEHRLRLAIDATGLGTWDLDLNQNTGTLDARCRLLYGFDDDEEEVPVSHFFARVHPDDRAELQRAHENALGDPRNPSFTIDFRLRSPSGAQRWVSSSARVLFDDRGRPRRMLGTTRDVTAAHEADARLQAEYAVTRLLAAASESKPALNAALGEVCRKLDWDIASYIGIDRATGAFRQRASFASPLMASSTLFQAIRTRSGPPSAVASFLKGAASLWIDDFTTTSVLGPEMRAHALEAGLKCGAVISIALADDVVGLLTVGSATDRPRTEHMLETLRTIGSQLGQYLERADAENAVRESEARIRAILESAQDSFISIDDEGRIRELNPAAQRTFGYGRDDVIGQHFVAKLVPPSVAADRERWIARYRCTPLGMPFEVPAMRADGSEFPAEVVVTKVGSLDLYAVNVRDVTERKRADEERERLMRAQVRLNEELELRVQQRTEELRAANQELEAFSYSVSHDLRSPLRAIDGFSENVLKRFGDKLDDRAREHLQRASAAARRMSVLIDDLLQLSRVTRSTLERQALDLSQLAQSVASEIALREPERKVDVVIAPGLRATGDPRLLRVVFDNLLGNAWKFTRAASAARIEVGETMVDGTRAFFVRDNGLGFDMAYADKLFQPFSRLTTDEKYPGTGIGLATVSRAVRRHGGNIWAMSALGEGATFFFRLGET